MLSLFAMTFTLQHCFTAFISIGRKMRKIYFLIVVAAVCKRFASCDLCEFLFYLLLLCSPILSAVNSKERLKSNHRSVSFYIYSHVQRSTNGCLQWWMFVALARALFSILRNGVTMSAVHTTRSPCGRSCGKSVSTRNVIYRTSAASKTEWHTLDL